MKQLKVNRYFFLTTTLFLLLIFTACESESVNNPAAETDFNSSEYAILDFEDVMNTVEGGTVESDFQVSSTLTGNNNFDGRPQARGERRHLGRILRLLELSDEQKETVKVYMQEGHECTNLAFEQFHAAIQPILENANEERQAILEQYRNGEITNEETYFLLQQLREDTHATIENDPDVIAAKQLICDCKISSLNNIASILTADQLTIWNDWYSNLDGPCFE